MMTKLLKVGSVGLSVLLLVLSLISLVMSQSRLAAIFISGFFVGMAAAVNTHKTFKGLSFTLWVLASVSISLTYPDSFIRIGGFELKRLIVPLLQIIMFGMGTTMSIRDFSNVVKMPKGVMVGVACQYTIMPFLALGIVKVFGFPTEIAVGILLVGSSPSGLASNVMTYLAKGNVALSITLTTVSTVLAPILTPFLMKTLGSAYIEIHFFEMMWGIVKIVIFPVVAGLIFNSIFGKRVK